VTVVYPEDALPTTTSPEVVPDAEIVLVYPLCPGDNQLVVVNVDIA